MPVLTVFAGPNGSGKSSIVRKAPFVGRGNLLEADAIAARIHVSDPGVARIAAGREVLHRTQVYLQTGDDFAIETTLSGMWTVRVINEAIARGFFVRLVYICLDSPGRCILLKCARERVVSALSRAVDSSRPWHAGCASSVIKSRKQ